MFSFLNKINIPKKIITCLIILVIVLVILYFTGFINKEKIPMPFEHYSNSEEAQGLDDFTDTLNLKI
jgi:flagellar biosynthesis/type III secretory pathway M-ring protein FliF/YscJ